MSYHDGYVAHLDPATRPKVKKKVLKLRIEDNFVAKNHHEINLLDHKGSIKNPNELVKEFMMYLERINHES